MAVPVIAGALKKHLLTHLSIGIGGGMVAGYAFWYGVHVPKVQNRDAWYLEYSKNRAE